MSKRLASLLEGAAMLTALALCACAGEHSATAPARETVSDPSPIALTNPGPVADLAVAGTTDTTVILSFTEVDNGLGAPAGYQVRFAAGSISWGSASDVAAGTCQVPLAGTSIGAKRICDVRGLTPSTAYQFRLVPFRGSLNVDATFGSLSNIANGTTTGGAASSRPATVTDLSVAAVTDTSMTLTFTEVADGAGSPASYEVRYAVSPIAWWAPRTAPGLLPHPG